MNISLRGQQGWMLLETILLGLILIVAVSCLPLYQQAIALRQADGARTTALFLAREEYSRIQWQADHNFSALPAGDIGWLGAPAVLHGNGGAYDVCAVVGSGDDVSRLLTVSVYWQSGSQHGLVTFERLLVAHPLKGSDDYAGE